MLPASSFMVGVTRFELVTSSVSGKRSPPELNARSIGVRLAARGLIYLSPQPNATHNFKFF